MEKKSLTATIYTKAADLPALDERNYFHSKRLFDLCRNTPRHKPYMVVARDGNGELAGHMLAIVRYRSSLFPPYLYRHCRVLGEGVYYDNGQWSMVNGQSSEVMGVMLKAITHHLGNAILFIEVSHLSHKMTGYRQFRQNGFFGVRWMSIHNSLHSRTPEERIPEKMMHRIESSEKRGVTTDVVTGDNDFTAFMKLLKKHNVLKLKRYVPDAAFFRGLAESGDGRLLVTRYKGRVIGCSALVFSERNAYLWYAAFRRKSYALVHPDLMTVWQTVKYCHDQGYDHIFFMDVGLPFRKNSFREFILSFGGKPTSTRRWFRFSLRWLNKILSWFYRE